MKKYRYKDEKSDKFWYIELKGNIITVHFGRTGTQGQKRTKEFATEVEATKEYEKLIKSKTKKGYIEITDDTAVGSEPETSSTKPVSSQQEEDIAEKQTNITNKKHWWETPHMYTQQNLKIIGGIPPKNKCIFCLNNKDELHGPCTIFDHHFRTCKYDKKKEIRRIESQYDNIDNTIVSDFEWKNGKLHGKSILTFKTNNSRYYECKIEKVEQFYEHGFPSGTWNYWNSEGQLVYSKEFENNMLVESKHYYKENCFITIKWESGISIKTMFHSQERPDLKNPRSEFKFFYVNNKKTVTIANFNTIQCSELYNIIAKYPEAEKLQLTTSELDGECLKIVNQFPQIKHVTLAQYGTNALPKEIGELKHIEQLDIVGNLLLGLPKEIEQLKNLKHLKIESKNIIILPDILGNISSLKTLNLKDAPYIDQLPDSIGRLENLEDLIIFNLNIRSPLRQLPDAIVKCKNLKKLSIEGTTLSCIPEQIGDLSQLESINFRRNQLIQLPDSIVLLQQLTGLGASYNYIYKLPDIALLPNLRGLSLANNCITEIPKPGKSVYRLILSSNLIETIPLNAATYGYGILGLERNPISNVNPLLFENQVIKEALKFLPASEKPKVIKIKHKKQIILNAWPDCLNTLTPIVNRPQVLHFAKEQIVEIFKDGFYEQGIKDENKIFIPIQHITGLGSCTFGQYNSCPNLPEYRKDEEDKGLLNKNIDYWWYDFELLDANQTVFPIRTGFNRGDIDRNEGYWGAFWDRNTKELIADLKSTGDMESTIDLVSEKHFKLFKSHYNCFPMISDLDDNRSSCPRIVYENDTQFEILLSLGLFLISEFR